MQSVAQTQDLLQAVWQQNYHGFSDYIQDETSLNPHTLLSSSNFHHLNELNSSRPNSMWNYHQKLMQDTFHTFGNSSQFKPMISSAKQFGEDKYRAGGGFGREYKNISGAQFGLGNVNFPALLPAQSLSSSRMPPPFPHSFGKIYNVTN